MRETFILSALFLISSPGKDLVVVLAGSFFHLGDKNIGRLNVGNLRQVVIFTVLQIRK